MKYVREWHRSQMLVAATVTMIAVSAIVAGIAVGSSTHHPQQGDVDAVDRSLGKARSVIFDSDWRYELNAEEVECVATDERVRDRAAGFDLARTLTATALATACTAENDLGRALGARASEVTVCSRDATVPRPVVLLTGDACTSVGLRTISDDDLAELNVLRELEVSLLAVPSDGDCPTAAEAKQWANGVIESERLDLEVHTFDEGHACYRPVAYWDRGEVIVQALGFQPE